MRKLGFGEDEIEAVRYWRLHHPDPRVQVRLEALDLRSQGVTNSEIVRRWGSSTASFPRYLGAYAPGGIEQLTQIDH
jgi:hypothetical protein